MTVVTLRAYDKYIVKKTAVQGCKTLQASLGKQQDEQEQGLSDMQGLVGAALAVPKDVVQPAFAALGKRHTSIIAEQRKLELQPALVTAVMQCIGESEADFPAPWPISSCSSHADGAGLCAVYPPVEAQH